MKMIMIISFYYIIFQIGNVLMLPVSVKEVYFTFGDFTDSTGFKWPVHPKTLGMYKRFLGARLLYSVDNEPVRSFKKRTQGSLLYLIFACSYPSASWESTL